MAEGAFNTVFIVILVLGLITTGYLTYAPLKKRCEALYECKMDSDKQNCMLKKKQKQSEEDFANLQQQLRSQKRYVENLTNNVNEAFTHAQNAVRSQGKQLNRAQHQLNKTQQQVQSQQFAIRENLEQEPPTREELLAQLNKNLAQQHPAQWTTADKLQHISIHDEKTLARYNQNKCERGADLVKKLSKSDTHKKHHRRHAICKMKAAGFCDYFGGSKCFKRACKKNGMKCGFEETHQGVKLDGLIDNYLDAMEQDAQMARPDIDPANLIDFNVAPGVTRGLGSEGYASEFMGHEDHEGMGHSEDSLEPYVLLLIDYI